MRSEAPVLRRIAELSHRGVDALVEAIERAGTCYPRPENLRMSGAGEKAKTSYVQDERLAPCTFFQRAYHPIQLPRGNFTQELHRQVNATTGRPADGGVILRMRRKLAAEIGLHPLNLILDFFGYLNGNKSSHWPAARF